MPKCVGVQELCECECVSVHTVVQNRAVLNSLALQADAQSGGLSSPSVLARLALRQMTNLQQLCGSLNAPPQTECSLGVTEKQKSIKPNHFPSRYQVKFAVHE